MTALICAYLHAACGTPGTPPRDVVVELAPTGKLRAAINLGNGVLAQKDAKTGELTGISVDLAKELAWRLMVPVELVPYDAAGQGNADATQDRGDVAVVRL